MSQIREEYAQGKDRPLGSFLGIMATYGVGVTAMAAVVRKRGAIAERIAPGDLVLISIGTYKLSRLIAKDVVTSPLRAPFTEFVEPTGAGEVKEKVRGTGPRRAIGALLTCPFCVGLWVATGFAFGLMLAPRATRLVASVLTALSGADVLQFAYAAMEGKASS